MSRSLYGYLKKAYPSCAERDIQNLVEAIKNNKFWPLKAGNKDEIYVIALTRALIPSELGFLSKVTYLNQVEVSNSAAPYCRKGRIIIVVKKDSRYQGVSILPWTVFLKIFRNNPDLPKKLLNRESLPPFIGSKDLPRLTL
jgi:hypothetical protein